MDFIRFIFREIPMPDALTLKPGHTIMRHLKITALALLFLSCDSMDQNRIELPTENAQACPAALAGFLDSLLADGFDYPVGDPDGKGPYTAVVDKKVYDSWRISCNFAEEYSLGIHPGIDLNGTGGGNTDLGQPVLSIARGKVVEAADFGPPWGNVVVIRHTYLENGSIACCYSLYAHLNELKVKKGMSIGRRAPVGTIGTGGSYSAHLHLEIRKQNMSNFSATYWPSSHGKNAQWIRDHYEDPAQFIAARRQLTIPQREEKIMIAIKHEYRLYFLEKGTLKRTYEIGLSQDPIGPKERLGDLKLPEGEYYITSKQKGPFYGDYSEFLGPCVIRISYPNIFDAHRGYKNGRISRRVRDTIIDANVKIENPPQNTRLGGKIVIHGWNGDWIADGTQNLTWGCIAMHNSELAAFYDMVPVKTKIIIVP
jgi:murein DD-endopeptidase MepM/ murein hydrolase activator NlpD